jgi:hypothetical protein
VSVEGAREGLLEMLLLGDSASESEVRAALLRFEEQRALLRKLPKAFRVHASSLSPLLSGETAVVALPLGVSLQ